LGGASREEGRDTVRNKILENQSREEIPRVLTKSKLLGGNVKGGCKSKPKKGRGREAGGRYQEEESFPLSRRMSESVGKKGQQSEGSPQEECQLQKRESII